MTKTRALIVVGTRPEAIKLAPVIFACHQHSAEIDTVVCSTGQHREMLEQIFQYFDLKPDIDLGIMRPNQTLAEVTSRCLTAMDGALEQVRPDCLVVQGDTTSVLAASLAGFYRRIPVVHVEAGLRTGNLLAPWPEEMNRRVTSIVTGLHCAPTSGAADALKREGVDERSIHVTGNTVIDALLRTLQRERNNNAHWEATYPALADKTLVLITGHRRENFGEGFENICRAIGELSRRFPDACFVYPVHLNPNVQEPVRRILSSCANVMLVPPASYPQFVWLMDRAKLILTDSGGVQEEAPTLRKPVLVMRDTTERPEAVDAGAVELVGTHYEKIVGRVSALLTDEAEYARHQIAHNPYGDGKAADRIANLIKDHAWDFPVCG